MPRFKVTKGNKRSSNEVVNYNIPCYIMVRELMCSMCIPEMCETKSHLRE